MSSQTPNKAARLALEMNGKLTIEDSAGNRIPIVIQRVGRKFGNGRVLSETRQVQVRRHSSSINDRMTHAQLARRARFDQAVKAWQALSEPEQAEWRARAKREHRTGYNLFLSHYLRHH
jgi:hypothetical protein